MLPTPDTSESSLQISSTSVAKSVEDSEDNEADDGAGLAMDGEDVEENEDEELIILTQPKMRQVCCHCPLCLFLINIEHAS